MDANFVVAHEYLGRTYLQEARFEEAFVEFQRAITLSGDNTRFLAFVGYAYALSGKKVKALKSLDELKELSSRRYVSSYDIARIYAGLGEKDQAFEWLEKAVEARAFGLHWLTVEPEFGNLRSDRRFQDLLRRVGLPKT